jgi:hypothetical protein
MTHLSASALHSLSSSLLRKTELESQEILHITYRHVTIYEISRDFLVMSAFILIIFTYIRLYALDFIYSSLCIIVCVDTDTLNYHIESGKKNQLDILLLSYNFPGTIIFPARVQNTSITAIDNILINLGWRTMLNPYFQCIV